MTSDLSALLAAVAADPADDVARLVYADCLEEHGNTARARFIRLQVEAERLHEHSAARAGLDRQAQELFDAHWMAWWGEVCAAVGFPPPRPRPTGTLGRLAARVSSRRAAGWPYQPHGTRVGWQPEATHTERLGPWHSVRFRRGFPESVQVGHQPAPFLRDWPTVSPLSELVAYAPQVDIWLDGPYLAGVRSVELWYYDPAVLTRVLDSPHLAALDRLSLSIPEYEAEDVPFAGELAVALAHPRVRQLERLAVPVWDADTANALAAADALAGLVSLEVSLLTDYDEGYTAAGERLAALAHSPHLAGLTELTAGGGVSGTGLAAFQRPTWAGLRRLDLELSPGLADLNPLADATGLPHLADLRLSGLTFNAATIDVLVRAPLLKRVRHLALQGWCEDRALLKRLVGAVDAARIETFALPGQVYPPLPPGADGTSELRAAFGERLRIV